MSLRQFDIRNLVSVFFLLFLLTSISLPYYTLAESAPVQNPFDQTGATQDAKNQVNRVLPNLGKGIKNVGVNTIEGVKAGIKHGLAGNNAGGNVALGLAPTDPTISLHQLENPTLIALLQDANNQGVLGGLVGDPSQIFNDFGAGVSAEIPEGINQITQEPEPYSNIWQIIISIIMIALALVGGFGALIGFGAGSIGSSAAGVATSLGSLASGGGASALAGLASSGTSLLSSVGGILQGAGYLTGNSNLAQIGGALSFGAGAINSIGAIANTAGNVINGIGNFAQNGISGLFSNTGNGNWLSNLGSAATTIGAVTGNQGLMTAGLGAQFVGGGGLNSLGNSITGLFNGGGGNLLSNLGGAATTIGAFTGNQGLMTAGLGAQFVGNGGLNNLGNSLTGGGNLLNNLGGTAATIGAFTGNQGLTTAGLGAQFVGNGGLNGLTAGGLQSAQTLGTITALGGAAFGNQDAVNIGGAVSVGSNILANSGGQINLNTAGNLLNTAAVFANQSNPGLAQDFAKFGAAANLTSSIASKGKGQGLHTGDLLNIATIASGNKKISNSLALLNVANSLGNNRGRNTSRRPTIYRNYNGVVTNQGTNYNTPYGANPR